MAKKPGPRQNVPRVDWGGEELMVSVPIPPDLARSIRGGAGRKQRRASGRLSVEAESVDRGAHSQTRGDVLESGVPDPAQQRAVLGSGARHRVRTQDHAEEPDRGRAGGSLAREDGSGRHDGERRSVQEAEVAFGNRLQPQTSLETWLRRNTHPDPPAELVTLAEPLTGVSAPCPTAGAPRRQSAGSPPAQPRNLNASDGSLLRDACANRPAAGVEKPVPRSRASPLRRSQC